ncbi:MAG: MBL fold metallo-hydrolase [Clostridia bacterium]|nr:MBL fold metallo-hydrolase [Clostridia bacterium]
MFDLIQVAEHTYYVDCPVRVGVWEQAGEAILIDSGNSPESAARIHAKIRDAGLRVRHILNTHCHPDHIGGNRYFSETCGATCWCSSKDAAFCAVSELGTAIMYGGRPPERLMLDRFMKAEDCPCREAEEFPFPEGMELVDLAGHSMFQKGVRTPDGVCFMADCVASEKVLDRFVFTYAYDIARYRNTLTRLTGWEKGIYIPSHCEPCEDIASLAAYNLAKLEERLAEIVGLLAQPMTAEELLTALFRRHKLRMTLSQRYLIGSTLSGMLSYLMDCGKITTKSDDGRLLWLNSEVETR